MIWKKFPYYSYEKTLYLKANRVSCVQQSAIQCDVTNQLMALGLLWVSRFGRFVVF